MKLLVVGGGIAGLSTAYFAQKAAADVEITLIESNPRLGGKIITDTAEGFIIEGGPDSFITQKQAALKLCLSLGIYDQLIGTNDDRRKIYILRNGKLHEMPDGLMMVVPTRFWPFVKSDLISWAGKIRMGMDLFVPPRQDDSDESLADFLRRRVGQEALEILGEPMMAGIHVADAETLSLKATFPRFIEIEKKYGSLTRGMLAAKKQPPSDTPMFMTMKGGLKDLIAALENAFTGKLISGKTVAEVMKADQGYRVILSDGTSIVTDAVILATPAYVSAKLLAHHGDELVDLLNKIRYVSTATVSLGYKNLPAPLEGFGFVIPRSEPTRLLACTISSIKFDHRASENNLLIRVFIGGPRRQELVSEDDATLIKIATEELQTILGITAEPSVTRVFRWIKGNPQYEVGHLDRVDRIEALCPPGIFVTGSAYRGVGMPDCIDQAEKTALKALRYLKHIPT